MRDNKIDFVRAICSLTVILAHVSAPNWVNVVRSFDVVALVMVSGMSLLYTSEASFLEFLKRRMKKLLIPTIIMMIIIFCGSWMACKIIGLNQLYSDERMFRSFLFLDKGTMGYIWIVRVYLIIAIFTPIIRALATKIISIWKFFGINFFLAIIAFFILKGITNIPITIIKTVLIDWIYGGFVYSVIAFNGFWIARNKDKYASVTIFYILLFVLCMMILSIFGEYMLFDPNIYKFPPRLYYCIYGLMMGTLLYIVAPEKDIYVIKWISHNSFSIYLWHIIILHVYGLMTKMPILAFLDYLWGLKYVVVTMGTIIITYFIDYLRKQYTGKVNA